MAGKRLNVKAGDRYGRLTIIEEIDPYLAPSGQKQRMFNCKCDCGNSIKILLYSLRRSNTYTHSCGCYQLQQTRKKNTNHNLTKTSEFRAWTAMKTRCYNTKTDYYKNYGGRGITVCDRWLESFENFIEDMGMKPSPELSIDRINNDLGYSKENCRWATILEQQNNRRCSKH